MGFGIMKKKILFVTENMNMNGANKSLINLLHNIDLNKYSVDLLVFSHEGVLLNEVPRNVNVIPQNDCLKYYEIGLLEALAKAPWKIKILRFLSASVRRISLTASKQIRSKIWRLYRKREIFYDVAIGYCEGITHEFVLEKVNASVKVGWIHIPASAFMFDNDFQIPICKRLDRCVTVSEDSKKSLIIKGVDSNKIIVIHNIVEKQKVLRMSVDNRIVLPTDIFKIVTIGRLSPQKNIDGIIYIAKSLYDKGYHFIWYIVGGGNELENYKSLSHNVGVENLICFTGEQTNPYPYLRQCDLYVQPSRFEGWGIAVSEAKVLYKPILVSDLEVFREQITDGVNGKVSSIDIDKMCENIGSMIDNADYREMLANNLKKEEEGLNPNLEMLYGLLNS